MPVPEDEVIEDVSDIDEIETDAEETEDAEEEAEETAAEEEGSEDEPEETDDEEESEDAELGARAQKRIKKLIAERKEATAKLDALTKQLDEAKKLSGDDGKAIMAAAEASGILPGLMTKDDADAEEKIRSYGRVIDRYEEWLDEHDSGDEYEIGEGKTLSYRRVERRVNQLKEELRDMKSSYGPRQKELRSKVREIFELGTAALKAGWKPGGKKVSKVKKVETGPGKKSPKPKAEVGRGIDPSEIDVDSGDDLERFIVADNRRRKK